MVSRPMRAPVVSSYHLGFRFFLNEIIPASSCSPLAFFCASAVPRLFLHLRSWEGKRTTVRARLLIDLRAIRIFTFFDFFKSLLDRPSVLVFFPRAAFGMPSRERKCISRRVTAHAKLMTGVKNVKAGRIFAQKKSKSYMVAGNDFCTRRARHHFFVSWFLGPFIFATRSEAKNVSFGTP